MSPLKEEKIGEILLDLKYVTQDQLDLAWKVQEKTLKPIGEILTELGFLTQEKFSSALASKRGKSGPEEAASGQPSPFTTRRLTEILLDYNLITRETLSKAVEEQKRTNKKIGEILIEAGHITEERLTRVLSAHLGIPYTDLNSTVVEPEAIEVIKERLARKTLALPLSVDRRSITVAMADPLDFEAINDITFATSREVRPTVAPINEIREAIRRYYHLSHPLEKILGEIKTGTLEVVEEGKDSPEEEEGMEDVARSGESPPIIRLVNSIIVHAAQNNASDIHFEPKEKTLRIRERIDGLLTDAFEFPKLVQGAVTSRVKIMAQLDITEKNLPQDGRIKVKVEGKDLDLRVSTLPSHFGEKITIRVLNVQGSAIKLTDLGPCPADYDRMRLVIEQPQGVVLITGPTGSGKTSTLYAMLNHIWTNNINIMTLEDPIEYQLPGVTQVGINEKTGLTFAYALRSVLRQDPDVILVGEMRDQETAKIAIEASLTGHLVETTLHTNTAIAAITRLKNLGIPSYQIASSLNGVVAQKLVRKICEKCKQPYSPTEEERLKIQIMGKDPAKLNLFKGAGCSACNQLGYKGRIGVFEILVVDPRIRELIANDRSEETILKAALNGGMRLMQEDALEKVNQGITTIEELMRVVYMREEEAAPASVQAEEPLIFRKCPNCGFSVKGAGDTVDEPSPQWKFCPVCGRSWQGQTRTSRRMAKMRASAVP